MLCWKEKWELMENNGYYCEETVNVKPPACNILLSFQELGIMGVFNWNITAFFLIRS